MNKGMTCKKIELDYYEKIKSELHKYNNKMSIIRIDVNDLSFEERVSMKCFYCSKYDTKWTCPPRIPKLDYRKVISEYENAAFVKCSMEFSENNFNDIRNKSTNELHKSMLYLEKVLWDLNYPMCLTFIGGSCKLCKNGCAKDKCRNPKLKRIPIEAIGVNVIKTLEKYNESIDFTIKNIINRYGLILW